MLFLRGAVFVLQTDSSRKYFFFTVLCRFRDINILRENLFAETELVEYKKTCFYADSIHKVVGENIKFRSRHGAKKDTEELLHPLRIFISNDNVKAAYNLNAFDQCKLEVAPHYLLTVKPCQNEKKGKSGKRQIAIKTMNLNL